MQRKQTTRAMLTEHRDWLLNTVIPGYQRRDDKESVRRSVEQLDEIEKQLSRIRHGEGRNAEGKI